MRCKLIIRECILWIDGMGMYIVDWWYGDVHCGLMVWECTLWTDGMEMYIVD